MPSRRDEFLPLSVTKIIALVPAKTFSTLAHRRREILVAEALKLDSDTKAKLFKAANDKEQANVSKQEHKHSLKRKRDTTRWQGARTEKRKKKAVLLELPTDNEAQDCLKAFINATGNTALAQEVCIVCAREVWASEGERRCIEDLPNQHRLHPHKPHAAHTLFREMLLVAEKIEGSGEEAEGFCCKMCHDSLEANRVPRLSLANGMWIGAVPTELKDLTIPEQMLIALHFPRCFIFKLFAKEGGKAHQDPDKLQQGMRGNVTSFELNTQDIAKMINGRLFPRETSLLPSVLSVAFVGHGKLPKRWLKSTFRVRRQRVFAALTWLKANHPRYHAIEIDPSRLASLPEDDVPDEVLLTVRVL